MSEGREARVRKGRGRFKGSTSSETPTRKNFNLYQSKIDLAKEILGTGTETEAIDQALDLVIFGEELAQGTRRARDRPYQDVFGEVQPMVASTED